MCSNRAKDKVYICNAVDIILKEGTFFQISLVYSSEMCFTDRHSQAAARMRAEKDRRAMSWVGEDTAAAPAPVQKNMKYLKEKEES